MSLKQGGLTLVPCSNIWFPNMIWRYLLVQEQNTLFGNFSLVFFYLFGYCSEMQCRCPELVCFIKIMSRWVEAVELLHVKKLLSPSWVLQANPPVCVLRHTSTCTHAAKVILEVAFFINKEGKILIDLLFLFAHSLANQSGFHSDDVGNLFC